VGDGRLSRSQRRPIAREQGPRVPEILGPPIENDL